MLLLNWQNVRRSILLHELADNCKPGQLIG